MLSAVARQYTWGRDLSGSLEGAGGIGGLLAMKDLAADPDEEFIYAADAMGNIGQLVALASGYGGATADEWHADRLVARYEYDPYGNVIGPDSDADGTPDAFDDDTPYAAANVYRFSTKPQDAETGLSYFGFRYYNARLGRWINRDPLNEDADLGKVVGRRNTDTVTAPIAPGIVYSAFTNAPLLWIDPDGRAKQSSLPGWFPPSWPHPGGDQVRLFCWEVAFGDYHCDVECISPTGLIVRGGGTGPDWYAGPGLSEMLIGWIPSLPGNGNPTWYDRVVSVGTLSGFALAKPGTCSCIQRLGGGLARIPRKHWETPYDIGGPDVDVSVDDNISNSSAALSTILTCCDAFVSPLPSLSTPGWGHRPEYHCGWKCATFTRVHRDSMGRPTRTSSYSKVVKKYCPIGCNELAGANIVWPWPPGKPKSCN